MAMPSDLPWTDVIDGKTAIDHGSADVEAGARRSAKGYDEKKKRAWQQATTE
jgi:hypothetical protein